VGEGAESGTAEAAERSARIMPQTIGFIGLGIMGKPMSLNLVKAGYAVVVHNRSRGPVDELVRAGARAADGPRQVAEQSEVVITMLPDSPQVAEVVAGPGGVLEGARDGLIVVDMSTISPLVARELAEQARRKGVAMLDAPVSGGDKGAVAGTLSIMVGGDAAVVERCRPTFETLGKTVVHVGPAGSGQIVKLCNQVVDAVNYQAAAEALVIGSKAGVDPHKILQVLAGGLAASRVMEQRGPGMLAHDFAPGFRIDLHRKDLDIALAAARAYDVPLPAAALVQQEFNALAAAGRGNLDHSALLTYLEDAARHRIGEGPTRADGQAGGRPS
jgi:2-hydroxy-3-oxopropionate reductase